MVQAVKGSLLTRHSAVCLPLLAEIEIDPQALQRATGVDRLSHLTPNMITMAPRLGDLALILATTQAKGEALTFSSLPKALHYQLRGTMRSALTARQAAWIGLVPVAALPVLQEFFGQDVQGEQLVRPIGPAVTPNQVSAVQAALSREALAGHAPVDADRVNQIHVPVAINPSACCQAWCQGSEDRRLFMQLSLQGVDSVLLSSKDYRALRGSGVALIDSSWWYRALRSPKFWAYAIVFIYSSLRALPVVFVKHFHGSVFLLWAMDILTAIPYTWGLIAFVAGRNALQRYLGLAVTLVTFIAPYVYFYMHGRHYPVGVNLIVAAMIIGAIAWEGFNYARDAAVARGLLATTSRALRISGDGPLYGT